MVIKLPGYETVFENGVYTGEKVEIMLYPKLECKPLIIAGTFTIPPEEQIVEKLVSAASDYTKTSASIPESYNMTPLDFSIMGLDAQVLADLVSRKEDLMIY